MDFQDRRVAWPDIAKAACIVAVVLFHVVRQHYVHIYWGPSVPVARLWLDINDALQPIRMPLFFAISGLMAAPALQRPWPATAARRIAQPLYLYLLWGLIFLLFFSFGPQLEKGYAAIGMGTRISLYLYGVGMAWYLWALGAFFIVTRLTRSWPFALMLGAAFLLAFASKTAYPDNLYWVYGGLARNLPYFIIGARMPALLWRLGQRGGRASTALPILAFAALTALNAIAPYAVLAMILEGCGIVLGIALAAWAARFSWARRAGRAIGTRTLPIYVLHFPILAILAALTGPLLTPDWLANRLFAASYPLILTAATIVLSLFAHRLLMKGGGSWLFALPGMPWLGPLRFPGWAWRRKPA